MASNGLADRMAALESHFLPRHLSPAQRAELLTRARIEQYAAAQPIFRKGDAETGLMAVLRGRVKLTSASSGGKEMVFDILAPSRIFGEIALLDGKPRSHDATAIEESEVLALRRRDLIPYLELNPAICIRFMEELCARLRRTDELVADALFLGLSPRLAKRLLGLAEHVGAPMADGAIRLDLALSQKDLASLVGMTRESINKQIGLWRRSGILSFARGKIAIRDIRRLRQVAETGPLTLP